MKNNTIDEIIFLIGGYTVTQNKIRELMKIYDGAKQEYDLKHIAERETLPEIVYNRRQVVYARMKTLEHLAEDI